MTIEFDGRPVPTRPGQTVAAALWAAGIRSWRTTRIAGASRGLYCGIGACFDCLATIDGRPGQRACLAPARAGTAITGDDPGRRAVLSAPVPPAPVRGVPEVEPPAGVAQVRPSGQRFDVAVIGAGPGGLAAAAAAAFSGGRVALLDGAARPGGQFWRHRDDQTPGTGYRDWKVFLGLRSIVEERVDYFPGATVWSAEPGFVLHTTAGTVGADRLVLATGAHDRCLPFPGWEAPGVVTPGAAQALLKGSGTVLGGTVVVAGAGPFLLPVAVGLAEAGARVAGVFEAGDPRRYLARASGLVAVSGRLPEAGGYAVALARHRIPYRIRRAVVAARGSPEVTQVDVAGLDRDGRVVPGSVEHVDCDAVAVGYGFTANVELALHLGCAVRVSDDCGLAVVVDDDGQTSVPGVFAAGEVTGIGGGPLAVAEGELAGAAAAESAGGAPPLSRRELAALRRRVRQLRGFAGIMHAAHPVPVGWPAWLDPDTVICRCEEVPYHRIEHAVRELGATDARTVKLLTRAGMGWCQGRICGYPTAQLTAGLCGRTASQVDLAVFARRPLAAPVLLGELAGG